MNKLVLLSMLLSSKLLGSEVQFLQPQEIRMEMHQIDRVNDPYLYPRDKELRYGGAFITNFRLIEWEKFNLFSNNRLSFEQSQVTGKILHGGWNYQIGAGYEINRNQAIEIGKYHYSYHIFEDTRELHFPTFDSYFINLIIYKK